MIPKKIWTAWLGGEPSPQIQRYIDTQKIPGYEHHLITLENCKKTSSYVMDAIAAKKYVKAVDFLRMQYLYEEGGIFLDADVEILPDKNFDDLLRHKMFGATENNGFIGVAVMGSIPGHPFVKEWMAWVQKWFKGDDDKNFESSMEPVVHGYYSWGWDKDGFELVDTNILYPYDHQRNTVEVEPGTITYHHFLKSWVKPTVTFLVPTLNRPEGLRRCLESIERLEYPKDRIRVIVIDGPGTVPQKIKRGYEQSEGDYIVYAADDTEFTPDSLLRIITLAQRGYDLVGFNTGPMDLMEHFIIKRDFVPKLDGGEIFSTDFHHVGTDDFLRAQAEKMGQYARCGDAIVIHKHFSRGGQWDDTYAKAWDTEKVVKDRATLQAKLDKLHGRTSPLFPHKTFRD